MKLSAIILALTNTEASFQMTSACIASLLGSGFGTDIEIIVVESNKQYQTSGFVFPQNIKVIIPPNDFNFHKFLNIGIKACTGDFIALCNNDLLFRDRWFSEILKVALLNPEILSFSPAAVPPSESQTPGFSIGYKVMTHIKGWCIVAKKELFDKIGLLDEQFDFYFADNDYAMTLKSRNIPHALVYNSVVIHLEKAAATPADVTDQSFLNKYKIPRYLRQDRYRYILQNEKNLSGFLAFHNKWGAPDFLYRKNKIADLLIRHGFGFAVPLFFKIKF